MRIGNLDVGCRAVLAPMAGLTDIAFRQLLDEMGGVGLMVTEMISAEGLRRQNVKSMDMIRSFESKTPQLIQLFAGEAEPLQEAAKMVEQETGFAGIDLNMGCPAGKVTKKGAGAMLLQEPGKIKKIVRAVRSSTSLPLTVKIRLGYSTVNVLEVAGILEGEGVDAITVHFRLKNQGYGVKADWSLAPLIKEKIKTVLIGNGDIMSAPEGQQRLNVVDGIMIGRGAIANPFIFQEIAGLNPTVSDRMSAVKRLTELIVEYYEPSLRLARIKALTRFLVSRRPGSKKVRQHIYQAARFDEAIKYFGQLFQ